MKIEFKIALRFFLVDGEFSRVLLPHRRPIPRVEPPRFFRQSEERVVPDLRFRPSFETQLLDFAFVGFAQFVDFVAGGVAAGDGGLDAGEGVEGEDVLSRVGLLGGDGCVV